MWSDPQNAGGVYFAFAIFYVLLFVVSLQTVASLKHKGMLNKKWQVLYYSIFFVACLARITYFTIHPIFLEHYFYDVPLNTFFVFLPSFLFLTNFIIILYLWIEVYYTTSFTSVYYTVQLRPLKLSFIFATTGLFLSFVALLVSEFFTPPSRDQDTFASTFSLTLTPTNKALFILESSAYLLTCIGFWFMGIKIYLRLKKLQSATEETYLIKRRILYILAIVTLSSFVRATFDFSALWRMKMAWWEMAISFLLMEILPFLLLQWVLHKESPRREREEGIGKAEEGMPRQLVR